MPEEQLTPVDSDWLDSAIAEFGFFSKFPRLSTTFLREKAERQLRDKAGRWRQERATLGEPDRDVSLFRLPRPGKPTSTPSVNGPQARVVRIKPSDVTSTLRDAGFPSMESRRWKSRGEVFQVMHDGQNPAFVFVVDESAATTARMEPLAEKYGQAVRALAMAESRLEKATKSSADRMQIKRLNMDLEERKTALMKAERDLSTGGERWRAAHGHTPETTSPEAAQRYAEEAGAYLAKALEGAPQWFKDRNNGIVIEFDESLLVSTKNGAGLVNGQAMRGGRSVIMHRGRFNDLIADVMTPEYHMPTDAVTTGEYAVPHEIGHLVDEGSNSSPWASTTNEDIWIAAVNAGLMSTYGAGSATEGYAEAFTMWLHDPEHPLAKMYAERFGWNEKARKRI